MIVEHRDGAISGDRIRTVTPTQLVMNSIPGEDIFFTNPTFHIRHKFTLVANDKGLHGMEIFFLFIII